MINKLKILALAAVSTAAISMATANTAHAADFEPAPERTISGVLDIFGSYWQATTTDEGFDTTDEQDRFMIGGEALADIPFNDNWSLQLDIGGETTPDENYIDDLSSDGEHYGSVYAGGHLNYREVDRYLLGGFVGWGQSFSEGDDVSNFLTVGAEMQYYMNNITLYGQVGFVDGDNDDDDTLEDGIFGRGVARFFMSPNTKLQAEFSVLSGDADGDSGEVIGWGAEIEHQVSSWTDSGVSGYVAYSGLNAEFDGDEQTEQRIMIGIRVAMNSGTTLLQKDRMGATLDLPDFVRWGQIACSISC
jgi:hypothetical protein